MMVRGNLHSGLQRAGPYIVFPETIIFTVQGRAVYSVQNQIEKRPRKVTNNIHGFGINARYNAYARSVGNYELYKYCVVIVLKSGFQYSLSLFSHF